MKQKTYLVILIGIVLATCLAGISYPARVSAAQQDLEITYPDLPLVEAPTTVRTILPNYIKYIFTLAMVISGLIIFGVFLTAGLRYLTSVGNPGAVNESKSRMLSAALGTVIIFASFLILNTINPQLTLLQVGDLSATQGVKFTDIDGVTSFTTNASVPDFSLVGITPNQVKFLSLDVEVTPCEKKYQKDVNEDVFSAANCEDKYSKITADGAFPNTALPGTAQAAKLFWSVNGVYAYDDQADQGYKGDFRIYDGRYATLGDFNDKISSILPHNPLGGTQDTRIVYDAVLHKDEGFKGECKFSGYQSVPELNSDWNNKVSSITTFKHRGNYQYESGGVAFYENINYQGDLAGGYGDEYIGVSVFKDLVKDVYSVKIEGDYLVVLAQNNASNANNGNTGKSEIFFSSDSNLNDNYIGQCVTGGCNPSTGCFSIGPWCPVCTVSCARSFRAIPIIR